MSWTYYQIPTYASKADHEIGVSLGGLDYTLRLIYNAREQAWYVSLYDADGNALYLGRKMVAGWPLFFRFPQARPRYGDLVLCGDSGVDVPYARLALGDTLTLYYQTVDV